MKLEKKVAVITGAAGGIGLAAAQLFAREGAQVMLVDLNEEALAEAAATIGNDRASYVAADISRPEQMENAVRTAVWRYGRVDVFVANAGIEGAVAEIAVVFIWWMAGHGLIS